MVGELEFVAVGVDCLHHPARRLAAALGGGGGEDRPADDPGEQVPGLREQADLDGEPVLAGGGEKLDELGEGLGGIGAGRLEEGLEGAGAAAPDQRVRTPGRRVACSFGHGGLP